MTTMIGGEVCKQRLVSQLLPAEPRGLTRAEIDGLWRIFVAIGTIWKNTVHNSAGLKSSWLEFLTEKTMVRPSYVTEYVNALEVVEELIAMYEETEAFEKLFLDNGIPLDSKGNYHLDTRLAHAKPSSSTSSFAYRSWPEDSRTSSDRTRLKSAPRTSSTTTGSSPAHASTGSSPSAHTRNPLNEQ